MTKILELKTQVWVNSVWDGQIMQIKAIVLNTEYTYIVYLQSPWEQYYPHFTHEVTDTERLNQMVEDSN